MSTDKPPAGPTPIYDEIVAELGEPDLTPAPDYEVTAAQAVLALAGDSGEGDRG